MTCFGTVDLTAAGGADVSVFLAAVTLSMVGVETVEEMEVRRFASSIMEADVDVAVVAMVKKTVGICVFWEPSLRCRVANSSDGRAIL